MPPSPPEQPATPHPPVLIKSPRDATTWAIVYRRRIREKPRDRLLKVVGMLGALLVHVMFLLGAILGSPYDLPPPPPEPRGTALEVRLINNKPLPPPPPPVRGIPPKEHGPTHRGNTTQVVHASHEVSTAAPVADIQQPPMPVSKQQLVVTPPKQAASEQPKPAAAPLPPITLPKPSPAPILQARPLGLPPPAPSLQALQVPQPVPPQFQPEPVRKAQPEGTQPMPPLPSLALPVQPAQSALTAAPPQIAVEKPSLQSIPMPQVAAVAPAPTPAAPPAPALQPVPMPAQPAPSVNLQLSATPLQTPSVPRTAQQVVSPALQSQQEAQLAPVPVTPVVVPVQNLTPSAPSLTVEAPKLAVPAVSLQPQWSPAPAPTPSTPQTQPAPSSSSEQTTAQTSSPANQPQSPSAPANPGNASASTAPNATPEGSESANPGQPNGLNQPAESNGSQGTQASPAAGAGNTASEQGQGTFGTPNGTYIQLKPRGDTEIMSHNVNLPTYRPTRFDQYWTPKGESSIDTALRHAVEKTTVSHTFNLPQGVRIKCTVMPLLPSSLFGCTNPDPPATPLPQKIYDRLNLPTANPSVPKSAPAVAATQASHAAPVVLDNSAECAAARVSGGPIPPNCPSSTSSPVAPLRLPASASTSWVPASDQFH